MSVICPNCNQETYGSDCQWCRYPLATSVVCPNCGQKTQGTDCQWCHYPLIAVEAGKSSKPAMVKAAKLTKTADVAEGTNEGTVKKTISWVISALLVVIIGFFAFTYLSPNHNVYMVRSESMKPAIKLGDVIITGPAGGSSNSEVKPDTIITYERGKELITHRVVSIDGDVLVTKGDNTEEPDPWKVTMSDVQGVYMFKIPYVGYALSFIRSKVGWFVAIILPAALLVALLVKEIVKEAFRDDYTVALEGGGA